jgi:hypothetical protein
VVVSIEEREQLAAIAADRNRPRGNSPISSAAAYSGQSDEHADNEAGHD